MQLNAVLEKNVTNYYSWWKCTSIVMVEIYLWLPPFHLALWGNEG